MIVVASTVASIAVIVAVPVLTTRPAATAAHASTATSTTTAAAPTSAPVEAPVISSMIPPVIVVHVPLTALPGTVANVVAGIDFRAGRWISTGGSGCAYSRNRGQSWETGGNPTDGVAVDLRLGASFDTHECASWTLYRAF